MRVSIIGSLLVAGCAAQNEGGSNEAGSPDSVPSSEAPADARDGPPVVVSYRIASASQGGPQPHFHTARLSGTLALANGCVAIAAGDRMSLLVFPEGAAAWDRSAGALAFAGREYRPGDRIEVGGSASGGPAVAGLAGNAPPACSDLQRWYVAPAVRPGP